MEAMGLVARERLAHDQRRVMVSLTPTSRTMFRQMKPRIEAVYQTLETDLGPELTGEIYDTLDRFLARLSPTDPEACE
jgi:DNA-binding MarR family transcriptional regulator